jgi:integrative and conjugative element protein (TIGR02256 family)
MDSEPDASAGGKRSPLVWLEASVVTAMVAEAAQKHPNETGGILMGFVAETPAHSEDPLLPEPRTTIAVMAVIGPGPRAVHARATFVPDHEFQNAEVARLYATSGCVWTYLGDWHTHPDSSAYLSERDTRTLARIATSGAARVARPVMVVLGQKTSRTTTSETLPVRDPNGDLWYVAAWRFVRLRSRWAWPGLRRLVGAESTRCALRVMRRDAP